MAAFMYDLTVPALVRGLTVCDRYLDKAAASAAERGFDPAVLINARLAPDMLPFSGQIQICSDTAKGAMTRLTGLPVPSFEDNEKTIEDLKARVAKTIALLQTFKKENFEGSETRSVELKFGSFTKTFSGLEYVSSFVLPNFYFHVATAHDLLRHNGVKVGKRDYLGAGE